MLNLLSVLFDLVFRLFHWKQLSPSPSFTSGNRSKSHRFKSDEYDGISSVLVLNAVKIGALCDDTFPSCKIQQLSFNFNNQNATYGEIVLLIDLLSFHNEVVMDQTTNSEKQLLFERLFSSIPMIVDVFISRAHGAMLFHQS